MIDCQSINSPIESHRIPPLQPLGGRADGILDAIEIGSIADYCRHCPIDAGLFDLDVADVLSAWEAADFTQRDQLKILGGYDGHRSVPNLFRNKPGSVDAVPSLTVERERGIA
ncbi:hypothetical protein M2222_008282 [Bradyrhizobium elkanii]|uniref:hypothetical protein n=1 Tax=Bradyrhizobium elkanii TaxID=29448 RepID=UPI002169E1EB|nr:hypothetical protein [Bradyrhizobium elkanii]MCS3451941.1 hypothetical protein [Bradyrhizobium elkanii]MCS3565960.1 hypothetical protein [Bradyrhizobium elkanii]MCW2153310.1 hypothetical protein [Bradyrhizobium elkanii]MCW2377043.1 hypothetical protein [Bradyrhizobium elkanii]